MLVSDGVGLVAAILLAEPGFRDQVFRYQQARETAGATASKFAVLRTALANTWREKRDDYSGVDALCTLAGAILLLLTFALKLGDL